MSKTDPNEQQLKQIGAEQQVMSAQTGQLGQQLVNPLITGTLPLAAQALVNQVLQANLAGDRSTFGRLGLTGSTMEQSAENQARQASLAQTFGIEEDMAKLGQGYTQLALDALSGAGGTEGRILNAETAQDTALMGAIGSFGKALGPMGGAGFGLNNLGIGLGDLTGGTAAAAGGFNASMDAFLSSPEMLALAV